MALTFTPRRETVMGGNRIMIVTIGLDVAYPTGGYAVGAGDVGMPNLLGINIHNVITGGYAFEWSFADHTIKAYRVGSTNSAMAEVPNGTDLSSISLECFAISES